MVSAGGLIAFRTDTFYGLGADPFSRPAIDRIKRLKGRKGLKGLRGGDEGKPILIVVSDLDQVDRFLAERTRVFDLLAGAFWPGPLTLIGKARREVPNELTAGTGTIGVRLPDDEDLRVLVRACGGALTATSANPAARAPACTAREVETYFPDGIDLIVDGGRARSDRPSTVLDLTGTEPGLVREGAISRAELEAALETCMG